VNSDPHPDRRRSEPLRCLGSSLHRPRRRREGNEKRIALGVDFDPAVRGEGLAQDAAVVCERLRVRPRAELAEQPRRAFDVGEEEGDGAGGKIVAQRSLLAEREPDGLAGRLAFNLLADVGHHPELQHTPSGAWR
jgi:hypothetical protein